MLSGASTRLPGPNHRGPQDHSSSAFLRPEQGQRSASWEASLPSEDSKAVVRPPPVSVLVCMVVFPLLLILASQLKNRGKSEEGRDRFFPGPCRAGVPAGPGLTVLRLPSGPSRRPQCRHNFSRLRVLTPKGGSLGRSPARSFLAQSGDEHLEPNLSSGIFAFQH